MAGFAKRAQPQTPRHAFAAHLFESGYDIRTVQGLAGHRDTSTAMISTPVLTGGGRELAGSLDRG
jgi:site-specific recombinase XerD